MGWLEPGWLSALRGTAAGGGLGAVEPREPREPGVAQGAGWPDFAYFRPRIYADQDFYDDDKQHDDRRFDDIDAAEHIDAPSHQDPHQLHRYPSRAGDGDHGDRPCAG